MEPPSKRPRFGPAPFEDDPEADELNEQPEEVNARRDPAVQLERSRAFAAFKLKSAFERIFEKYEKDFTGVGDEIDLRTGEIVVDNGHIQSLKNAQLGGSAEGEDSADSGDGASEAGSLNEEERMLRGKAENRLSQLGHNALPMVPLGMGPSHFARGAWSASHSLMGLPPMLPTMGYPGQMPFGGFPMQYGTPMSMAATDPTWRTPELPSTFVGHRMLTGEATPSVRKKVARLSLSAARGQDTGDEDDIFLRPSATKDNGSSETPAIKKKLLLARHAPEQAPSKKKKGIPAQTHKQSGTKPDRKEEKGAKAPAVPKQKVSKSTPDARPDSTNPRRTSPNFGATGLAGKTVTSIAPKQTNTTGPARRTSGFDTATKEVTRKVVPQRSEAVDFTPHPNLRETVPDSEDLDVYINLSDGPRKHTRKPRNQTLRVELRAKNPQDARSFQALTPEPSESSSPPPRGSVPDESSGNSVLAILETQGSSKAVPAASTAPEKIDQAGATVAVEEFSRNIVDPTYAFSDEEEPALPKRRTLHCKPNKPLDVSSTEAGVLRERCQNLDTKVASRERERTVDKRVQKPDDSAVPRAESPTLSLHLDDVVDHRENNPEGAYADPAARTLEQQNDAKRPAPVGATERSRRLRRPTSQAEELVIAAPSSGPSTASTQRTTAGTNRAKAPSSETRKSKRLSKTALQNTPTKPPREADAHERNAWGRSAKQEIAQTSPAAHPENCPHQATESPALTLGPHSDHDARGEVSGAHTEAPSPTLTDPTSKPSTVRPSPSASKQHAPRSGPRTPVKTPRHRPSKPNPVPGSATTTTSTKRKGILSLLPDNDDEEDELSILSPIRPASGPGSTTVRSTPAAHHVRLGLVAPTGSSSKPSTSSKLKLQRAVARGSVSNGIPAADGADGASFRTPTKKRRGAKGLQLALEAGGRGRGPGSGEAAVLQAGTPASGRLESDLVQTPGGTMRRCGEDGFRCERDFCFSCL
ncbi:uncharacterized protein THITE_2113553 [Thermothielavioides terrestris NRRL 8126]|uniref:Uncharacterized protein n=1 Tax=Thermothielavioides terrestris (strain ATCC 38088 / NRRL 8126) TaxID=578455 RepID=G2R3B6_THETT|nr:uncharacterized protein THITE_2113553 [Thermothielavioides terrestris NRRL 8126]AEO65927.1 hypothetical protein THITE_2113553 [Thermothielavioides terrestris NRRL 8126]